MLVLHSDRLAAHLKKFSRCGLRIFEGNSVLHRIQTPLLVGSISPMTITYNETRAELEERRDESRTRVVSCQLVRRFRELSECMSLATGRCSIW